MSDFPNSTALLKRVVYRLYAVKLARRTFVSFLVFAVLYGLALAFTRLTGLVPDVFFPMTLLWVPAAALLAGLAVSRLPSLEQAARQTDSRQGTQDLFLTLTMLDRCTGEYKPLVGRDAEQRARQLKAESVVPFAWERPSVLGGLVMPGVIGLLALGVVFLPALDPFGKQALAKEQETMTRRIAESRKETEARKAQIEKQKDLDNENSEDVEQALEKLVADFQKMRKHEKMENAQRLAVNQKALGEKWRKLNAEQLKELMNDGDLDQRFGGQEADQMREWQRELQQGSSEALEQALEELQQDLQQLAKTDDPLKKGELMKKIEKQLREMSDFATDKAGSQPLTAALQRTLDQMEALKSSDSQELSQEILEAMQESMELSQAECQDLAQAARDAKSLEEALKLISMAKQLNGQEMLDGEMGEGMQSIADYAELYAQMMGEMDGGPLGGEGMGEGGVAPEDDSIQTDFVDERSKSAVQKGKILLSMKTKGLSDTGEARKEYRSIVSDIKQGAAEAIEQEQIPPGYRDAIQKYFDKIEAVDPALEGEVEGVQ
jgi:chemotaxis protein histidine kinase CheA